MKLEIGKFYKTRDGKKAYLFNVKKGLLLSRYLVAIENGNVHGVYQDGRYSVIRKTKRDLVDRWVESKISKTQQRDDIMRLLKDGKTYSEIRKQTGAALGTISRVKKLNDYNPVKNNSPEMAKECKKLLKEKLSLTEIAARVNKSYGWVCWYVYSVPELRKLKMKYDNRHNNGKNLITGSVAKNGK